VSWKLVYDNGVAVLENRDNALFHIREKHRPVDRALKHEWRDHGALPLTGDKRDYFPMPLRSIADQPLPARTAAAP
jgi:hypothetical protein